MGHHIARGLVMLDLAHLHLPFEQPEPFGWNYSSPSSRMMVSGGSSKSRMRLREIGLGVYCAPLRHTGI
jgi:hypothetical protein